MEPAEFFSIKFLEGLHVYQDLFNRDRTKHFEIRQKEEKKTFHDVVLDDNEFEETFNLFSNDYLEIPGELDFKMIDHIFKYLYFKEIKEIPDEDLFPLLKVASFMKIHPVVQKIKEFLEKPAISCQRAMFFLKEIFKFEYPEIPEWLMKVVENFSVFLLESHQIDTFFNIFDGNFINRNEDRVKFWFDFFIEKVLKKIKASTELIKKFYAIFEVPLFLLPKQEDPNLNQIIFNTSLQIDNKLLGDKKEEINEFYLQKICQNLQTMDTKISTEIQNLRESNEIMRKRLDEVTEKNNQPTKKESALQSKLKRKVQSLTHRFTLLKKKVQFLEEKEEERKEESSSKLDETSQEKESLEEEASNDYSNKIKSSRKKNQKEQRKKQKSSTSEQDSLNTSGSLETMGEYKKSFAEAGYEFFRKGLEQYFEFTDSFKTVEKIFNDKRFGVRCRSVYFNEFQSSLKFSIIIKKTKNSHIFFGFTSKYTSFIGGFYNKKTSYMLNLTDGKLFNGSKSHYICRGMKKGAKSGDKYTAILDFNNQSISFLLDDESYGETTQINISEKEYAKLVPCVDIQHQYDKITIINS